MLHSAVSSLFLFNDLATTEIYTLSLHDALPILEVFGTLGQPQGTFGSGYDCAHHAIVFDAAGTTAYVGSRDRKSTRLNSSHITISYAVFCLKKKKTKKIKVKTKKKDISNTQTHT